MKLDLDSIVRHAGIDHRVEAVVTYRMEGRTLVLARVVGGGRERWLQPLQDELDERAIFLDEVHGLDIITPPPATICYRGGSYVPVLAGPAQAKVVGPAPGRASGPCELWRFRAAGDLYLQLERWPAGTLALAGASVHRSMLETLPGDSPAPSPGGTGRPASREGSARPSEASRCGQGVGRPRPQRTLPRFKTK